MPHADLSGYWRKERTIVDREVLLTNLSNSPLCSSDYRSIPLSRTSIGQCIILTRHYPQSCFFLIASEKSEVLGMCLPFITRNLEHIIIEGRHAGISSTLNRKQTQLPNSYSISHLRGTVTIRWRDSDSVVTIDNYRQHDDYTVGQLCSHHAAGS